MEFLINKLTEEKFILEENTRLKVTLDEWRIKITELEELKSHGERVKGIGNQDQAYFQFEIVRLENIIEVLLARGPQIVKKIIDKRVEVPFEVVKERFVVYERRIRELDLEVNFLREENRKIKISLENSRPEGLMIERQSPKIVDEVIKIDDRRIRELEAELNSSRKKIENSGFILKSCCHKLRSEGKSHLKQKRRQSIL